MTQKRSEYEAIRKKFFKAEDILNEENNRNKLYEHASINRDEEEDKTVRGKLLNGVDNLHGQSE